MITCNHNNKKTTTKLATYPLQLKCNIRMGKNASNIYIYSVYKGKEKK